MKKGAASKIVRSTAFLSVLIAFVTLLNSMMMPIDESVGQWKTYEQLPPHTIDVLFVGNSHSYSTFAPMEVWNQAGITSWNLSDGSINQRHKLAYLQQALLAQHPKVVVIEVWVIDDPTKAAKQVNNWAYRSMPLGWSKLKSIVDTDGYENLMSYDFPLLSQHFAWQSFSREVVGRLLSGKGFDKLVTGGATVLAKAPLTKEDFSNVVKVRLDDVGYSQALVDLHNIKSTCLDNNISVVFCLTPMISIDAGVLLRVWRRIWEAVAQILLS